MIPLRTLRGSRRSLAFISPAKNLKRAVSVALVLFLLGSIVHGISLFSFLSLGTLKIYRQSSAPPSAQILLEIKANTVEVNNTNTSGQLEPAVDVTRVPTLAPFTAVGASSTSLEHEHGSTTREAETTKGLVSAETLSTAGAVAGGVRGVIATTTVGKSMKTETGNAAVLPSAPLAVSANPISSLSTSTPLSVNTAGQTSVNKSDNFVAEIFFGLNHVKSNCENPKSSREIEFCKFLRETIGVSSSYSELRKMDKWAKVDFPKPDIILISYIASILLLLMSSIILLAPLMSLTGYTKRFIGSTLLDVATATAGFALGWQRWLSISTPASFFQHLSIEWADVLQKTNKTREPSALIFILSSTLWTLSACVVALEWILHARDGTSSGLVAENSGTGARESGRASSLLSNLTHALSGRSLPAAPVEPQVGGPVSEEESRLPLLAPPEKSSNAI